MKKIIITITLLLSSLATTAQAQQLDAKPLADMIKMIESAKFKYIEHGLAYGFVSVESCLYTSKDFAILKNYCYPNKPYPAKGFTIISAKFGVVELYQENLQTVIKRDVRIDVFPENFKDYATTPTASLTIQKLNSIFEDLYSRREGACWSTNFSRYTEVAEVQCNAQAGSVGSIDKWGAETQAVTANSKSWNRLMNRVNAAITK